MTATGYKSFEQTTAVQRSVPLIYQSGCGWGGWTLSCPLFSSPQGTRCLTLGLMTSPFAFLWASIGCFKKCLPDTHPYLKALTGQGQGAVCAPNLLQHTGQPPQQKMAQLRMLMAPWLNNPAPFHTEPLTQPRNNT